MVLVADDEPRLLLRIRLKLDSAMWQRCLLAEVGTTKLYSPNQCGPMQAPPLSTRSLRRFRWSGEPIVLAFAFLCPISSSRVAVVRGGAPSHERQGASPTRSWNRGFQFL
jgi:hypothetical protein